MPVTPATFDLLLETPSVILEAIQRIRQDLDEPTVDGKFTNNYITRMNLIPALTESINLVNLQADNSVILRMTVPIEEGTEYYQLPPCISSVVRIAVLSDEGYVLNDWVPRGDFCPGGAGWVLEGNTIAFRPHPAAMNTDYSLWYIPGGDILIHFSASGVLNQSADGDDVFRIAATLAGNDVGSIDKRENAYCGQVLRIFTDDLVIERIIDEHYLEDGSWKVHTRVPLPEDLEDGTFTYEIVPFVAGHLWVMAARKAAIELGTSRNVPDTLMRRLFIQYDFAKKAVLDNLSNLQARTGKYFQKDTIDNPRSSYYWFNQLMP